MAGRRPDPLELLERNLRTAGVRPGQHVCLGLSGGLDSTAMLHALVELRARWQFVLRAIHVNHGLLPEANAWAERCVALGQALAVPVSVLPVEVDRQAPQGLEGAAREARYRALAGDAGDWLLLAHHRDDQAETVLLALLRGSGPAGLAAMGSLRAPARHPLGGMPLRPWLDLDRSAVLAWAQQRGLDWIEDPSNRDLRQDRNFLRHVLGPALEPRFPGWRSALARSAHWAAEAQDLLEQLAELDLQTFPEIADRADPALLPGAVEHWLCLPEARIRNLLRMLLAQRGLQLPPAARLTEWVRQLAAAMDRAPELVWSGWTLRRWAGRLWLEPALGPPAGRLRTDPLALLAMTLADQERSAGDELALWDGAGPRLVVLPDGSQVRFAEPSERHFPGATATAPRRLLLRRDCGPLQLRACSGGSRLQLHAGGPGREIRKLFQEAGIPPWRRPRMPGLYAGGQLVGVVGLALAADLAATPGSPAWLLLWQDAGILPCHAGHGQDEPGMV